MPKINSSKNIPANKMHRKEYACSEDWIRDFLARVEVGHVATVWEEQPFITPLNFWYDPQHHAIYFHTNTRGQLRANIERNPQACFEASQHGKFLPANTALEFGIQYESVVAFGSIALVTDPQEKQRALYALIRKHFPDLTPGEHYRPITPVELKRTAVYALAIEHWSGKRNWKEQAWQSPDWHPLPEQR